VFNLRRVTAQRLSVVVCILASSRSRANNNPILGSGCVEVASPAQLGTVNDHLSGIVSESMQLEVEEQLSRVVLFYEALTLRVLPDGTSTSTQVSMRPIYSDLALAMNDFPFTNNIGNDPINAAFHFSGVFP
jgi:hypothetical protein